MIKNIIEDLFIFHGRLGRYGFFLYTAATIMVALFGLVGAQHMVGNIIFGSGGENSVQALGAYLAFFAIFLTTTHAAVVVKRLHDLDISGWWFLSIALADLLCFVSEKEPGLTIVTFAATAAYLALALIPGSKNVNYYSK